MTSCSDCTGRGIFELPEQAELGPEANGVWVATWSGETVGLGGTQAEAVAYLQSKRAEDPMQRERSEKQEIGWAGVRGGLGHHATRRRGGEFRPT